MTIRKIFLLLLSALLLVMVSCSKEGGKDKQGSNVDYYTCSMHPSVKTHDPKAKCPICSMDLTPVMKKTEAKQESSDAVDYYTCSMHPSVKSKDPKAKCPICSMDLTPVKKKKEGAAKDSDKDAKGMGMSPQEHAQMSGKEGEMEGMKKEGLQEEQPSEFMVPVERQQQIGVTYAKVERKPLSHAIRSVGMVTYDKQRHWDIVSRVEGYVSKLHVSSPGELVEKGEPLLSIYSPDLLTTQREFVDLLKMRDRAKSSGSQPALESAERLIESAKRRLLQWNVAEKQLSELEQTLEPKEYLTLFSPFRGLVQKISADQGSKVMSGDHLVDVADLSVVWVWAEFYQDELPMLKKGLQTSVTTSSYPDEKFNGTIVLVDPFINDATRTGRVRLDIENPDLKLRPSMYVNVELSMDMGEALTVPIIAVLPTGKRNVVFVDKTGGKLEPRFVVLGQKYGDYYEIKSGLKEGERVVSSANFLIDAESKVQGALKSW
jgi:membrane fusion protein, copper/silver efflux system